MKFQEMVNKVKDEMTGIAFDNRKDIYSQFEFDYLHLMSEYTIGRQGQAVYTFTNKDTNEKLYIEFYSQKNGSYYEIKKINYGRY